MSGVTLVAVDCEDVRLGRLLQLYVHEFSALVRHPIGADALFAYDELSLYVHGESERLAVLFLDAESGTPLGFALAGQEPLCWHVEEFFIIAGARRRGVGMEAAEALFAARPGRWTLTVRPENPAGLAFWRRVAVGAEERVEVGEDDGVARTRLSFVR